MQAKLVSEILGVEIHRDITGIVEDQRHIYEDCLFVVRKGKNYNSFQDIDYALKCNAIVVHENIYENRGFFVSSLAEKIDVLLRMFYDGICDHFKIVGVCGTNGKSSVVMYLYSLMRDYKCMKIGTHFIESGGFCYENENTTPSKITLMHLFHLAKKEQIEYVFMEVSSHALDQKRIELLKFDALIYTNIDRDHLDYHKSVLHYRYTKYKALQHLKKNGVVLANKDELYYQELKKKCRKALISYGQKASHFQIQDVRLSYRESSFYVNRFYFRTSLLSMVNVYNVSACIALLRLWNIPYFDIYKQILMLYSNEGRLEVVYDKDFLVFVDYAHTSKAFYETLHFVSSLKHNRIIVVVGCGGEREKKKRQEIGYFASSKCDICIFTEDNSRYESVYEIMEDMSFRVKKKALWIASREKAIEYAIKNAQNNDIILVSGKGNEQFLLHEGKKIPFNDKQKILEVLERGI